MVIRIQPAVSDPDAARSLVTLLSQLPECEPVPPAIDSTQLIDTLSQQAAESPADLPEVVLVHELIGSVPALELIREVALHFPAVAVVLVTQDTSPGLYSAAMDAGARGVAGLPLSYDELAARIDAAAAWVSGVRRHLGVSGHGGRDPGPRGQGGTVLTVSGAKGGVGTTLAAVQLALAARASGRDTALVDLDLQAGDVASCLDVQFRRSIVDLAGIRDISPRVLQDAVYTHESGLGLLLAPGEGERGEEVDERAARQILGALRTRFEVVVVDCGSQMHSANAAAVELADLAALLTTPDVISVRGAKRTVRLWERLRIRKAEETVTVVNRASRHTEIQPSLIARVTGTPMARTTVPAAFKELQSALDAGRMQDLDAKGSVRQALWALAGELGLVVDGGGSGAKTGGRSGTGRGRRGRSGGRGAAGAPAGDGGTGSAGILGQGRAELPAGGRQALPPGGPRPGRTGPGPASASGPGQPGQPGRPGSGPASASGSGPGSGSVSGSGPGLLPGQASGAAQGFGPVAGSAQGRAHGTASREGPAPGHGPGYGADGGEHGPGTGTFGPGYGYAPGPAGAEPTGAGPSPYGPSYAGAALGGGQPPPPGSAPYGPPPAGGPPAPGPVTDEVSRNEATGHEAARNEASRNGAWQAGASPGGPPYPEGPSYPDASLPQGPPYPDVPSPQPPERPPYPEGPAYPAGPAAEGPSYPAGDPAPERPSYPAGASVADGTPYAHGPSPTDGAPSAEGAAAEGTSAEGTSAEDPSAEGEAHRASGGGAGSGGVGWWRQEPGEGWARGGDRGAVSVEFAGMAPVVLVVLVLLWQCVLIGYTFSLAGNAADEAARAATGAAAYGDPQGACEEAAREHLPATWRKSASVSCARGGHVWKAQVDLRTPILFPGAAGLPFTVNGEAGAAEEG